MVWLPTYEVEKNDVLIESMLGLHLITVWAPTSLMPIKSQTSQIL